MLQGFSFSLPFLILRISLICCEGLLLWFSAVYVHKLFLDYMSNLVGGLFAIVVSPMGYLIGLALGAVVVKYVLGLIQYYFKLAHIVYLTMFILQYKPYKGSRYGHAFREAGTNFTSLALNDFTTRSIVSALKALKTAILDNDLMSKFKDPELSSVKFVKSLCTTALGNVINMTDELIVSYTWFTYDLYLANCKKNKKEPTTKQMLRNRATFMLEGITFIVRVFPQLLVSSAVIEVGFIIIANVVTIGVILLVLSYVGFSFMFIILAIILYRTLIQIFYYTIVESLRLTFYLHSFYSELEELEPFDIKESLSSLLGKVPLLKSLVKQSGQKIEASGSEGGPILEGDINTILQDNIKEVAQAFNLETDDLLKDQTDENKDSKDNEEQVVDEEPDNDDAPVTERSNNVNTVPEQEIDLGTDELDLSMDEPVNNQQSSSPFENVDRVDNSNNRRRR